MSGNTSKLPAYLDPDAYYDKYYEEIQVSKEKYNQLRKKKYPILMHQTYYEGYTKLYYDPELGEVVILIVGGT